MKIPRIVIAGTSSGVGKTSISCAIIYGIKKKGYSVQPFKVGPDYIDPGYTSLISGRNTRNLDFWLMGKKELIQSFVRNSKADISIIEGVMGYYDGFSGATDISSTHHVATILQSPVILVLDVSKTARSIAATILGFKKFHPKSHIVGVILNKLGSKKHEFLCKQAVEKLKIPLLGSIPKDNSLSLDSRHLGLIPAIEKKSTQKKIQNIAKSITDFLNIEKILKITFHTSPLKPKRQIKNKKPKTTVAVALDSSFNFYYHDNLDALRREGADIKFFSPISDSKIPKCEGIYIGGGFPEVLGNPLARNHQMRKIIKNLAENEVPIYAECGGLMYLTKSISYGKRKYKMVGLFDTETHMTKKMKLNYTSGRITSNCLISSSNRKFFGHEFHYSEIKSIPSDAKLIYELSIGEGIINKKDGFSEYNTLASYGHLYFDSSSYAENFVKNCVIFSRK